jgi:hypothetical protein
MNMHHGVSKAANLAPSDATEALARRPPNKDRNGIGPFVELPHRGAELVVVENAGAKFQSAGAPVDPSVSDGQKHIGHEQFSKAGHSSRRRAQLPTRLDLSFRGEGGNFNIPFV